MADGKWGNKVHASLFVGADVLHLDGAVQEVVMEERGVKDNGSKKRTAATNERFTKVLWDSWNKNKTGMRWQLHPENFRRKEKAAQAALLRNLDSFLQQEADNAVALFLDAKGKTTYDELKMCGYGKQCRARQIFLLLGGAHGFDGRDDHDDTFARDVQNCFIKRLGEKRVARVTLCTEPSDYCKFTAAQVSAFLRVEYGRGSLRQVIAGLEHRQNEVAAAGESR